ncbi:putative membrane protein [Synechococcus sp. BIOS-E4-1]|nr:putative membrane protein [Synechococcus sp. BIOS-E4-1]
MLKPFLIALLYVSSCVLALLQATRESTPQPIGLLIVAMVMTPVLVSIIAGLPVNCMSFQSKQID